VVRIVSAITRLLDGFAAGPASAPHPAVDNLVQVGIRGATAVQGSRASGRPGAELTGPRTAVPSTEPGDAVSRVFVVEAVVEGSRGVGMIAGKR
jgi:hypothetical protein